MYPGIMMTAATMCSPGLPDLLLRIFQKKSSIVFIPEDNWQTKQHRRTATDATNKGKVAQARHGHGESNIRGTRKQEFQPNLEK